MTWRPGASTITDEAWEKVIEYIRSRKGHAEAEEPDTENCISGED